MSEHILTRADRLRESAKLLEKADRLRRSADRDNDPLSWSLMREADEAEAEAEALINSSGRDEIERLDRIGVTIIDQYEALLTQADRLKAEIQTIADLIMAIETAEAEAAAEADEREAIRIRADQWSAIIAESNKQMRADRESHSFISADQWIESLRAEKADRYCEFVAISALDKESGS